MSAALNLLDEPSFIRLFHSGDKEAFRLFYDHQLRQVTFFAENIIKSQADAEDIVANAFHKLFHARATMTSVEHIKRWLFVTIRHECVDYLRLKKRKQAHREDHSYVFREDEDTLETERVKAALLAEIHREIEALPRQRKTILKMYFFEQRSTREIAELLDLNTQTVLNHKTKALDALKKAGLKYNWQNMEALTLLLVIALSAIECSSTPA